MDHEEFYMQTVDGEIDTYTRAEWDAGMGEYVHHLISAEDYAQAKAGGKDAREVTL